MGLFIWSIQQGDDMANEANLKRVARACTLILPGFGEMNFPSLNYAAGWLGSTYLKSHCDRSDIYVSYNVLAFLLDNKGIFQSVDQDHPLTGLQVVPLQINKEASNKESKELNNKANKQLNNTGIKQLRTSVIKENESCCSRELKADYSSSTIDETLAEFDILFEDILVKTI